MGNLGSLKSTCKQIIYYHEFQKQIGKFFNGEIEKDDTEIQNGYIINPEWIKEWRRRKKYDKNKKYLDIIDFEKKKIDLKQIKTIFDDIRKKDKKILDENNNSIIKYIDFMIVNEKILSKKYLENFVNEKIFKLMDLNAKITFEEIKYIFKVKMIIFFLENYQIIKILLSVENLPSKVVNITFIFFYLDAYNEFYKKFEKESSEEIIKYLNEIKILSNSKYSSNEDTFIVINEEKMVESLINCDKVIDKNNNNNKINFTLVKLPSFRGLENVGATCYMNATLQCLANLKLITNDLLNEENYNFLIKNKDICRMTYEYTKVLIGLFCDESRTGYYRPMDFKKTISEFNPLFEGIKANDSKDLIIFLLEILNKELVKIYKRKHKINEDAQNEEIYQNIDTSNENSVLMSFLDDFKKNYCSIIGDNLIGFNKSIFICQNCGGKTYNFNLFNNIIFSLEATSNYFNLSNNNSNIPIINFHHCFQFLSKEDNFNDTYCQICNKVGMSIYKEIKYSMPNYLIIILNRGRGNVFNCHVQIPEIFDSSQYVELKSGNNIYELTGIVSHLGESSMEGHFIAFCKHNIDGKWRCYNDSFVTESNKDYLNKGTPYILFYKKMNIENDQAKGNEQENQINQVSQINQVNQINNNMLNMNENNNNNMLNMNENNNSNMLNMNVNNNMLNMNVNNQFNLNNNIYQGNMLPYNNYNQFYNMNYQQNMNNNFINNQNINYLNNMQK